MEVTKYARVPEILIRKHRERLNLRQQAERELKEGGYLRRYLDRMRAQTEKRYRKVAQATKDWKQNNKSDCRVLAHIPIHDYIRWTKTDKHFFDDDNNLRSLRRDNPDARVYL